MALPPDPEFRARKRGIGLAMLRLDGFVSLDAGNDEAYVLTRPLSPKGSALHVNVDAGEGHLVAEIIGETGRPLAEFTRDDRLPSTTDTVDKLVRWKQHEDISKLAGQTIRIKLHFRNASLHSFTINYSSSR